MMENIHVRVGNGVLKFMVADLDMTPFPTGPSPHTGQKQRYPGRFVTYLDAHYHLDGKRILEMFSGSGELQQRFCAITTDIRSAAGPDFVAPYDNLHLPGKKFDVVVADPPYNAGFANEWTTHEGALPKPKWIQREAAKVLKIGGLCMILHVIQIPAYKENGMRAVAYHPIFTGPNNAARLLSVSKKIMQFDEAQAHFRKK